MKHILSFSGGKDSTYLAIYLVENSYPLDEAVMFDTGWEFPQMYKHIEKMRAYLENHNVELTVLKPKRSFDYLMTEKLVKERNGGGCHYGYSWCGLKGCRWGTTEKTAAFDEYSQRNDGAIVYIGIAADEPERLKKLYALALRGVGGEKEQAQAILDKLLKKYAMTLDDLDDEVIQEYDLEYHGKEQDRILMQTAYKVTDDKNAFNHLQYNHSGRACRTRLRVRCTAAQKAEIEFLFSFYVRLWEKEKEALLQAFFQKHRIFGNLKDGESGAELSPEELLKLELMMKGLSDEQPLKQLTGGAGGV